MKAFPFKLPDEDSLIILKAKIGKYNFRLALDTAAIHTTIDSNILYMAGYELKDSKGEVEVETANGIIISEIYELKELLAMGIQRFDFPVQVYDFLAHGITSSYNGVIGLDFLRGTKFCVDLNKLEVTV